MTKDEIIKKADEVAQKYNQDGLAPFPFENIQNGVSDLEILLTDEKEIKSRNISGAIFFKDKFTILINKNRPLTRMNFTMAHEVGHYFLHQDIIKQEMIVDGDENLEGGVLYRMDNGERIKIETEANIFAASLIMPERLLKEVWGKIKDPEECAKIFKVSLAAMVIRLERLGLLNNR